MPAYIISKRINYQLLIIVGLYRMRQPGFKVNAWVLILVYRLLFNDNFIFLFESVAGRLAIVLV